MAHWGVCMSLMAAGPEFQKERVESMKSMKELALHPAFPEHERAYADALAVLLMDGPEEARKAWKTLYETWPRDPYAPLFYAMLLRDGFDDRGKPGEGQEEAVRIVDEVLKKRPGSQAALFMRALLDEVAPVIPPETVETARRAVAANPQSSSAHHLLGHFLFRTGDYRGASAAFKKSEDLCVNWEKSEKVPRALNDAYFRSAIYRAVSEFCAGRYKEADRIASAVASVPLDKEYPLAPGTLLQIWEARNLPVRLMLANPDLPRQEYVLKASPAPLPKGFPDLSNGMMAMLTQYMGAKYSLQQGAVSAVSARFDKLSGIIRLLMDGAATAEAANEPFLLGPLPAARQRVRYGNPRHDVSGIRQHLAFQRHPGPALRFPSPAPGAAVSGGMDSGSRLPESRQEQGKPGNVRAGSETLPQPRRSAGNHEKGPRRGQIILFNKTH